MYLKICSDLIYKVNDNSLIYLVELFAKKENNKVVFFTKLFVNNGKVTDEADFSQILDLDVKELVKDRLNELRKIGFTRYEQNFLDIVLDYNFLNNSKIFVREVEEKLCEKENYRIGRYMLRIDKTVEKLSLNRDFIFSKVIFEDAIKDYLEYISGGIYEASMFEFKDNRLLFRGSSNVYVSSLEHILGFLNDKNRTSKSNYSTFAVDRFYHPSRENLALALLGVTPLHIDFTVDTKVADYMAVCIKKNGNKDTNFKKTKRKLLRGIPKYKIEVMFETEQSAMYVVRGNFIKQ